MASKNVSAVSCCAQFCLCPIIYIIINGNWWHRGIHVAVDEQENRITAARVPTAEPCAYCSNLAQFGAGRKRIPYSMESMFSNNTNMILPTGPTLGVIKMSISLSQYGNGWHVVLLILLQFLILLNFCLRVSQALAFYSLWHNFPLSNCSTRFISHPSVLLFSTIIKQLIIHMCICMYLISGGIRMGTYLF